MCSVFPLPKDLLPEINKILFNFLWNKKNPEPIVREIQFLPREKGCLRIMLLSVESQALRTKYLLQLGRENNANRLTNRLTYQERYWVASEIYNFNLVWNFWKKNNYPKNCDSYIPTFCENIISANITENIKKQ